MNLPKEDAKWLRKHSTCLIKMDQARSRSQISVSTQALTTLVGIYDVSMNPEFIEGRKSREQILTDFLSNFEGARGNNDGIITTEEFFDYYTDLSMSTPSDE